MLVLLKAISGLNTPIGGTGAQLSMVHIHVKYILVKGNTFKVKRSQLCYEILSLYFSFFLFQISRHHEGASVLCP